jgi:FtsZ-binding cell division protein ZapB
MKQNLSQQVVLEVLLREVESLKEANKELQRSYALAKEQSDRLEKTRLVAQVNTQPLQAFTEQLEAKLKRAESLVKVDTAPLDAFQKKLDQRLGKATMLPNWLLYCLVGLLCWSLLATALGVNFYRSADTYEGAYSAQVIQLDSLKTSLEECKANGKPARSGKGRR